MGSRFSQTQLKRGIKKNGLRNWESKTAGVKVQGRESKGNVFWFRLLGGLRDLGFEKLGFHCVYDMFADLYPVSFLC